MIEQKGPTKARSLEEGQEAVPPVKFWEQNNHCLIDRNIFRPLVATSLPTCPSYGYGPGPINQS